MQTYRTETVLIIISLGALLFVLGSIFQAITPAAGTQTPPASSPAHTATLPPQAAGPTGTAVRPANCVAVPPVATLGPGTPTVTPAAITHRFDLAPNLEPGQKSGVLVLRCDGTWDQYWLAPAQVFDPQKELKPGDVVFSVSPPAGEAGTQAPAATRAPTTAGTMAATATAGSSPAARTLTPSATVRASPGTPTRAFTRTATLAGYPAATTQSTQSGYPPP